MKITFGYYSPESRIKHIAKTFEREVSVIPRIGERIVTHKEGGSTEFEVKQVVHGYEYREQHKGKDYSGEGIFVQLLIVPKEQAHEEFHALLKASGCS